MARASPLVIAALFVFACVQIGDSLKCYHCSQEPGKECDSPVKNSVPTKECEKDQVCLIHNTTLVGGGNGGQIIRDCADKAVCAKNRVDLPSITCTTCEEDLCNSSPNVVPTFFVISIAGLMIAKIFV